MLDSLRKPGLVVFCYTVVRREVFFLLAVIGVMFLVLMTTKMEPPSSPPPPHTNMEPPSPPPPPHTNMEAPSSPPPPHTNMEPPSSPPPPHTNMEPPSSPPPPHTNMEPPSSPPPPHTNMEPPSSPPPPHNNMEPPSSPPPPHTNMEPPSPPPPLKHFPGSKLMALSLAYWEQTGNALQNLFALQCWAGTVNISGVVEPSIKPSWGAFYFVYDGSRYTFRDMFDVSHWNQMSYKYGASPLVTFEHFIKYAFRNIVFVQITYSMYKGVHCKTLATIANTSWAQFLIRKGFNFTKNVCLNFKVNSSFTQESFQELILGGTDHRVTVLFDQFNGIRQSGDASRIVVKGPLCHIDKGKMRNFEASSKLTQIQYIPVNSSSRIVPSQRIIDYVNRFISEQLSGEKYIAVMLRTERLKQVITTVPDNDTCADAIITDWNEMVTRHSIHKTLLFSDINTHGSKGWTKDPVATQFSNYIYDAINLTMNLNEVNSVLEGMTESQDSMQIAVLHRQLVTHATCVVVVGGGIFQEQALNMYFHYHRGHECYTYRTGRCLPSYVKIVYGL